VPGENIILPDHPGKIKAVDADLDHLRESLIRHAVAARPGKVRTEDILFLSEETNTDEEFVMNVLKKEGAL
jgi:hypothetical protein